MKYKISKNKSNIYDLYINDIKFNYRCPKDKYVADSYKCGNTPEEAKKNYQEEQKIKAEKQKGVDDRRGKRAEKVSVNAEKNIAKITDPALLESVKNVKNLIDKAKAELASGKVSKQTYKELRNAVNALRGNNSSSHIKPEIPIKEKTINPKTSTKNADKESIRSAYSDTMKKLTEYTSSTYDYKSDTYNQLNNAVKELSSAYQGNSEISKDRLTEINNIDIKSGMKTQLLETIKKSPDNILGISAIKQLRTMGLDKNGNDASKSLSVEELDEYNKLKQVITERIRNNYEISGTEKNEKRFIDLFNKKNLVLETTIKDDVFAESKTPLVEPKQFTYIDDNGKMFDVFAEKGTYENVKQISMLMASTPDVLRGEGTKIVLTTKSHSGGPAAACFNSFTKTFTSFDSAGSGGAQSTETVYHELAHGLDSRNNKCSASNEYNQAVKDDTTEDYRLKESDLNEDELDMLKGTNGKVSDFDEIYKTKDGTRYVSEYAKDSAKQFKNIQGRILSEDFAESVSFYFTNPRFKKVYPNRYKFIKAIVGMEGA